MKNKIYEIYILLFINIYYIKCDYAIFELNTYKNNSKYDKEEITLIFNIVSPLNYNNYMFIINKQNI